MCRRLCIGLLNLGTAHVELMAVDMRGSNCMGPLQIARFGSFFLAKLREGAAHPGQHWRCRWFPVETQEPKHLFLALRLEEHPHMQVHIECRLTWPLVQRTSQTAQEAMQGEPKQQCSKLVARPVEDAFKCMLTRRHPDCIKRHPSFSKVPNNVLM